MNRTLLLALCLLLTSGCVSPVEFEENTKLVEQVGLELAQNELRSLSLNALEPTLVHVEYIEGGFDYTYTEYDTVNQMPFQVQGNLTYAEIVKAEVFSNKRAILRGLKDRLLRDPKEKRLMTMRFSTVDDAIRWVNLVLSLKAHSEQGSE